MEAAKVVVIDLLRTTAAVRGEELLAEVPAVMRRVGMLMLVLALSIPAFLAGCLGVLVCCYSPESTGE
jgi:hypothetical protein